MKEQGLATFRFDWHGIGDSTGTVDDFAHHRPFTTDALAVLAWLGEEGLDRHILAGHCFGARTALATAQQVSSVAGLVLLSAPVRDHARGEGGASRAAFEQGALQYVAGGLRKIRLRSLLEREGRRRYLRLARLAFTARRDRLSGDPAPWLSPGFLTQLEEVLHRGIPVLFLYGTDDEEYEEFLLARGGRLGGLLDRFDDLALVEVLPGRVHGLSMLATQRAVIAAIEAWTRRRLM
jgi:pimeloyl-ACP methyl ester carboxylesterase